MLFRHQPLQIHISFRQEEDPDPVTAAEEMRAEYDADLSILRGTIIELERVMANQSAEIVRLRVAAGEVPPS